jgi:hypothetical protein
MQFEHPLESSGDDRRLPVGALRDFGGPAGPASPGLLLLRTPPCRPLRLTAVSLLRCAARGGASAPPSPSAGRSGFSVPVGGVGILRASLHRSSFREAFCRVEPEVLSIQIIAHSIDSFLRVMGREAVDAASATSGWL